MNPTLSRLSVTAAAAFFIATGSAQADTDFKFDPCTATVGGQLQYNVTHKSGGLAGEVNKSHGNNYRFFDLRLGGACRVAPDLDIEGMLRQRPIIGSDFKAQADRFGSREAWLGVKSAEFGALRAGRFITRMWSTADYPYGDGVNSEASDYGATPTPVTRRTALRYLSPGIRGFQGELTVGGDSKNRDIELYGNYSLGALSFDGVYDRSVMNGAYEKVQGGALPIGQRDLVNSALFFGGRYDFNNGAHARLALKSSQFSMPSDATGFYSTGGSYKTVTRVNSIVASGTYPLLDGLTFKPGLVRYMDSTTRGVTADDGATISKLGLIYEFYKNATIEFDVRSIRLDQAGAIPGSGSGANQAVPDSTDVGLALADRRWVFSQAYDATGLKSQRIRAIGVTLQYAF
jgi:predicted porin